MPGITPKYAPMPEWCDISGMRRTATYEALGRGDLKGIKVGKRLLIDVEGGLAWLATLPAARVGSRRVSNADCGPLGNRQRAPSTRG